MEYKIAVIPGDGIGVDVIREAVRSLDKIGEVYGHQFHKVERLVGGCCIDAYGVPIHATPFCLVRPAGPSGTTFPGPSARKAAWPPCAVALICSATCARPSSTPTCGKIPR